MMRSLLEWAGLREPLGGTMPSCPRSPHWPVVRAAHLRREPDCQVCGTTEDCEVHHCKPCHLFPDLELDPLNLLTLCRPHHLLVGHLMRWASWNAGVRFDAAMWRAKIEQRPEALQ